MREEWIAVLRRTITPVLTGFAANTLKTTFKPVYSPLNTHPNPNVAYVELFCRTLLGAAPYISTPEGSAEFGELLSAATDAVFRGYIQWECADQLLVEMALVSLTYLRYPALWTALRLETRSAILLIVAQANSFPPHKNNWVLFKCAVELFLYKKGRLASLAPTIARLVEFEKWYVGDGWYKDGAVFHMDYYNSFVILPFLVDVYEMLGDIVPKGAVARAWGRLQRQAEFLERLVAPDGTFPLFGRSMVYRTGVFHALAYTAARQRLPSSLAPAQVREALGAAVTAVFARPTLYDAEGFLQLGFGSLQPDIADAYSNNGSVYYALLVFAPLALPPDAEFWAAPPTPWTQKRAWSDQSVRRDVSIA